MLRDTADELLADESVTDILVNGFDIVLPLGVADAFGQIQTLGSIGPFPDPTKEVETFRIQPFALSSTFEGFLGAAVSLTVLDSGV